jgi:hypothetical protein
MDRSDLTRWGERARDALGFGPVPPGYRPPPGASMRRMMFAFVWLILGVIQTSIWFGSRDLPVLLLAGVWFVLAGLDIARARRMLQAEARAGREADDEDA